MEEIDIQGSGDAVDKLKRYQRGRKIWWASMGSATLVTLIYILLYWYDFLPEALEYYLADFLTLLAALSAAVVAILPWRQYHPGEAPRRVWGFFMLALWAWTIAQALRLALRPYYESFPDVFYFDFFWVAGYICFALALFYQYCSIYQPTPAQQRLWVILGMVGVAAGVALLAWVVRGQGVGETWLGTFLYILYPVADVLVGGLGIQLSRLFGRGLWGRPWWGLAAFAVADTFWTWYDLGGVDWLAGLPGFWGVGVEFFFDVLYFDAYFLFAIACLAQFLALQYGLYTRHGLRKS